MDVQQKKKIVEFFIDKNILPYFVFVTSSSSSSLGEYTKMVAELNIADRVIFLGKVFDRGLLKKVFMGSQAVVVPSRYEGFGLLTIEAFDLKRPLIAADVIAINETVRDDYNGLLFPAEDHQALADSIIKLEKDPSLQAKLIRGGEETLLKFKSQAIKDQWLDYYNKQV